MSKEYFLSYLLILCTVLSVVNAVISNGNIDKSSDLHTRKKRVINHSIGGVQPAHITLARHIVQIQVNDEYECAGSILEPDMIITARNCLYGSDDMYTVLSGSLQKNNGTRHRVLRTVKQVHYNLALIKIHPPISLSPNGNEKIMLYQGSLPLHSSGLFSGWGCTNISPSGERTYPQYLMAALLPLMTLHDCRLAIRNTNGQIPHPSVSFICTLDPRGERGACYGDEGGSLVYGGKLLGIYSHNERVNLGVRPDIFMSLDDEHIIRWINDYKREFRNMRIVLH